jgi:hypothetical protein
MSMYARLPSVLAVSLCGWFAAGCVNDENGLSIQHFVDFEQNMCVADPASLKLSADGTFDVGRAADFNGGAFIVAPVVANNLVVSTSTASPVNTVFLTGFDVELKPDPNDAALNAALPAAQRKFHVPAAGGTIFPGGGAAPMSMSEVAVPVPVLNFDIARLIAPAVPDGTTDQLPLIVHMRPIGTHSGVTIDGGWVDFPVYVCSHCLAPPLQNCPSGGFPPTATIIDGCNPTQDNETCCRDLTTQQVVCGADVPKMTM